MGSARKHTKNICTNGPKAGRDGFAVIRQMLVLFTEQACTGMQARRETSVVVLAMGKVLQGFCLLQEEDLILLEL